MIKLWEKIYIIICIVFLVYLMTLAENFGTVICVFILGLALMIPVAIRVLERIKNAVDAKNERINRSILKNREVREKELTKKFGVPIISKDGSHCDHSFRVYNESKIVLINDFDYSFSTLRSCELHSSGQVVTSEYTGKSKSSTGSLIGRTIAGGVLAGGAGAIIGGMTGTKTQSGSTTTIAKSEYTIVINFNDLKNPTKMLRCGIDLEFASDFANTINLIIEKEKQ